MPYLAQDGLLLAYEDGNLILLTSGLPSECDGLTPRFPASTELRVGFKFSSSPFVFGPGRIWGGAIAPALAFPVSGSVRQAKLFPLSQFVIGPVREWQGTQFALWPWPSVVIQTFNVASVFEIPAPSIGISVIDATLFIEGQLIIPAPSIGLDMQANHEISFSLQVPAPTIGISAELSVINILTSLVIPAPTIALETSRSIEVFYANWQASPVKQTAQIVVLAAIEMYDTSSNMLRRFLLSSSPYQSHFDEENIDYRNLQFDSRLDGEFQIKYEIPFITGKQNDSGVTTIQIANSDGALDNYILMPWAGHNAVIFQGDDRWPLSSFLANPLLGGSCESVKVTDEFIELSYRDITASLNKPIQSVMLTNAGSENKPAPLCFGLCYNVSLVLVNEPALIYKWHSGAVDSVIAVYDDGVELEVGFNYLADNANGEITFLIPPEGLVTLDGKGAKPGATWLSKVGEIISHILIQYGQIEASACVDFAELDIVKPYTVGIFLEDKENILDVVDKLIASVGAGYYYNSQTKKFNCSFVKDPNLSIPVFTISQSYFDIDNDIELDFKESPSKKIFLEYGKNWTIQKENEVGAIVTPARKQILAKEFIKLSVSNALTAIKWPLAKDATVVSTLIAYEADAMLELNERFSILANQVVFIKFRCKFISQLLMPGKVVFVKYNGLGLIEGRNVQILGITKYLLDDAAEIKAWFIGSRA